MQYIIKNKDTRQAATKNILNGIRLVTEVMEDLDRDIWFVHTSDGEPLPHFFSDTPMYCCRHKKGALLMPWCDSPGQVRRRFATHPNRLVPGYEALQMPWEWHIIDHQGYKVLEGKTRHFDVPQEAGRWAFMQSNAGLTYAFTNSKGKVWHPSLKGIYQFVSGMDLPKKRSFLAETLGDGTFKKRDDLDPWM